MYNNNSTYYNIIEYVFYTYVIIQIEVQHLYQ